MPSTAHFVLVHGASHGAWCWYKMKCLLECAGHKVTCVDLCASGINRADANTIFEFEVYNEPLDQVLSSLGKDEKVILVGHSVGGLNITGAMHKYTQNIQAAVYLVAMMLRNGNLMEEDKVWKRLGYSSNNMDIYDTYYGEGHDNPPTSVIVRKEFQRNFYYQRSPLEDATLASMLLRPAPVRAFTAKFPDEDGKDIDKVPRVYIKTLDDNTFSQEEQDALIKLWPPSDVFSIDSDHSPFFSYPIDLFGILLKVATKYD